MNTVEQVMTAMEKKGSEATRKTMIRHGAPENLFGIKVADLKIIAKKIKGNQQLALDLYDTGHMDAQYLAGIVADGKQMNQTQLNNWAKNAAWSMVAEYTVPGVATESIHAHALAVKWIKSKNENIACAGWNTLAGYIATRPDEDIDLSEIESYMQHVLDNIDKAPNRVKYCMNGFIISVGTYILPLLKQAKAAAAKLGKVEVEMGTTACKVPLASQYIRKVETMKRVGKKRKTIKC